MIKAGTTRRWRTALPAAALCGLAGFFLIASPLDWNPPGSALAAENDESPAPGTDAKDDADDPPEQEPQESTDAPGGTQVESESAADKSEEVFVPSEDISEDIDVPFPVDI